MNFMRPATRILVFIIGLFPLFRGMAQVPSSEIPAPGTPGTEYYVTFLQNDGSVQRFMGLMITSEVATIGSVDVPGQGVKTFSTQPGQVTKIEIPRTAELLTSEEAAVNAVHISSRAPVSVFVVNALYQSTGSYQAIPVNRWGTTYLPMCLPNADGLHTSQFAIVAAYDSTFIQIRPSDQTYRHEPGETITEMLSKGQTFLLQALPGGSGQRDLSASEITANRPIAVVAGNVRTPIALDGSISTTDWASNQQAMLLPTSSYGTRYYSTPQRPSGDLFRLMSTANATTITLVQYPTGGAPMTSTFTLDRGEIRNVPVSYPAQWSASAPFVLTQFRTSGPYTDAANSPAMIPLIPAELFSSRSVVVAPMEIGGDYFTANSLTIIARGPSIPDPVNTANPLRDIQIDGKPLYQIAPGILTQTIADDGTYYATISNLPAGGHLITSRPGFPFTGIISGNNGGSARDAYAAPLPFWMEQVGPDVTAPRIVSQNSLSKDIINAIVSDRTEQWYFSGVADAKAYNSPGWKSNFTPPGPDEDGVVGFQAIADPSGPLFAQLYDRDGNDTIVQLSNGVCFKTASPESASVTINIEAGRSRDEALLFKANPCGDQANILSIGNGSGNAEPLITGVDFDGQPLPLLIAANATAAMKIHVAVGAGTQLGIYKTNRVVRIDDSTVVIPITINVTAPSGVTATPGPGELTEARIYPNPFRSSATIELSRPLHASAHVTVADGLGRTVREFDGDQVAGRTMLTWDGSNADGVHSPAGLYFITIADAGNRIVRQVTLIR
jgi:hypothetical protein